MKKVILIVCALVSISLSAQTQLPNSDFESTFVATGMNPSGIAIQYDSLTNNWTCGNPIKRYIAIDDATTTYQFMKDTSYTSSVSSHHALVMRSFHIGPVLATGNVGTGFFVFNNVNPFQSVQFGAPFADRPISMIGQYQYLSMFGDSCLIEITLTKWNSGTSQRDTIGHGKLVDTNTTTSYHQFSIPIIYFSGSTPDTCSIVCLSSAGGFPPNPADAPLGQDGSTLLVDDFQMVYNTLGLPTQSESNAIVYADQNNVVVKFAKIPSDASIQIIDLSGKQLYQGKLIELETKIPLQNKGVAIVNVISSEGSQQEKVILR